MTTDEHPPWALSNGLPPAHLVLAALHAGSLIDACGSSVPAARSAYLLYPSDALYPPVDLRLGERLLLDCGLLLKKDGSLHPTSELGELLSLEETEATALIFQRIVIAAYSEMVVLSPSRQLAAETIALAEELIGNPERREAILVALGRKYDEALTKILGILGEELVVCQARDELVEIGRHDLAADVRRLSEFADDLGYDIVAPRLNGKRRLEVKTSSKDKSGLFHFFLSRNEIDWGLHDPDWALIACHAGHENDVDLIGWCRAQVLKPYLPLDSEGSYWVSAELEVPITLFLPGLPPYV